ncbi:hypothetical protein J2X20_001562 [Pelomonas saccharophila]|uniref:Uncharacterized protein n=1 Tax=Roseateles saccharophilus TaxID=304 RepID=A0ABU1YJN6_ROSSA|nr:hypothetical protein [Roseateles saccharophilus]
MQSPSETRINTLEVAGLHGDPIHRTEAFLLSDSRMVNNRSRTDRSVRDGVFST